MVRSSATVVARYIVRACHDRGLAVSNLKLQKLLYYAQGLYLANHDEPLFDDDFEAWVHGPVIRTVYGQYSEYGYGPITEQTDADLAESLQDHLLDVVETLAPLTAHRLERMTHSEKPWQDARGNVPPDRRSREKISKETMRDHFKDVIDSARSR